MDVEFQGEANFTSNNANSTLKYLRFARADRSFTTLILQTSIEDKRTGHVERINNKRNTINFEQGDLLMTETVIWIDEMEGRVEELSF